MNNQLICNKLWIQTEIQYITTQPNNIEMKNAWQTSELDHYLKQNSNDPEIESKTVFLSNPVERETLGEIFQDKICPKLLNSVKDTPLKISSGKDTELAESIEDEWHINTTKSLTFLIEDPERPLVPQSNVRWFCRGKIECTMSSYMISFDFFVYFPDWFSIDRLMSLLKDPAFGGMPPELHYENFEEDYGEYAIEFSKGRGADWGFGNADRICEQINSEIQEVTKVIYALNDFETDYESPELFDRFHRILVEVFGVD